MNLWERWFSNNITARLLGMVFVIVGTSGATVLTIGLLQVPPLPGAIAAIAKLGTMACACFVGCGLIMLVAGKHSGKFLITRHGQRVTSLQRMTTVIGAIGAAMVTRVLPKLVEWIIEWLGYSIK